MNTRLILLSMAGGAAALALLYAYSGRSRGPANPAPAAAPAQAERVDAARPQTVVMVVGDDSAPTGTDLEHALDGRYGHVDCLLAHCSHAYLIDYLRCRDTATDVKRCAYRDNDDVAEHLPLWTCGLSDEIIDLATQRDVSLVGVTQFPPPSDAKRRKLVAEITKKSNSQAYNQKLLTRAFGSPQQLAQRIIAEPACRTSIYPTRREPSADKHIALDEAGLNVIHVAVASLRAP